MLGLHVDGLGYSALHHQKMGVVHVQLDRLKNGSDLLGLLGLTVQNVLGFAIEYLSCHDNFVFMLHRWGRKLFVLVVKNDGDTGLHNSSVAPLVDQLLKVCNPHMGERGDS